MSNGVESTASRRVPVIVLAVLLGVLVAAAVVLGVRDHRHREDASASVAPAEAPALAAARAESVALTTIGYKTASTDLNRVLAGATGALRTQFEKERSQLPATLAQTKSVSRGTVLSSALSSVTGDRAQVLVAVDARVTGTGIGADGVLKHYRMVVTLQRVADRWLASDVAFAGAPQ
jgi:Mce-associated membrane protein